MARTKESGFVATDDPGRRYRAIHLLGKCEHCGMPLPLMGPLRRPVCTHCLEANPRGEEFWAELIDTADCFPDTENLEEHELKIEVVEQIPAAAEATAHDAPQWLTRRVRAARRILGAELEGTGGPAPEIAEAPRPVLMSCPNCSGSLSITSESERTTRCEYCQTDIYLPDDLWRRLHPVRKAEPWYVEYEGDSSATRRRERRRDLQDKDQKARQASWAERHRAQLMDTIAEFENKRAALRKQGTPLPLLVFLALGFTMLPALFMNPSKNGLELLGVSRLVCPLACERCEGPYLTRGELQQHGLRAGDPYCRLNGKPVEIRPALAAGGFYLPWLLLGAIVASGIWLAGRRKIWAQQAEIDQKILELETELGRQ